MQMMLTGKTLRADQARRAGFLDRLEVSRRRRGPRRARAHRAPAQAAPRAVRWIACCRWPLVRGFVRKASCSRR